MSAAKASTFEFPATVRMSSAACSARPRSRPVMPTRAPIMASPIAVALPMPPVAPVISTTLPVIGSSSNTDHDLSRRVPCSDIVHGPSAFTERIGAVDNRRDLAGLDQVLECDEIVVLLRNDKPAQALAHEAERHHRFDQPTCARKPPILELTAIRHQHSGWSQRPPEVGQRSVRDVI